jgi:sporulation protein YunB
MKKRRRPRHSCRSAAGTAILAVIIILLVIAVRKADKAVRPIAAMQAEHIASASANEIIAGAVSDYLSENRFTYSDFAAVLYDSSGNAVSVEAVPYNINLVQSELTSAVNRRLADTKGSTEHIPIGSLTGSYMLIGKGPRLKLKVCPVGSADVRLTSSFTSAGVNQTCHRISAVVTASVRSSVPVYSFDTTVSFEFLLAESIIVGDVPDVSRYAWNSI